MDKIPYVCLVKIISYISYEDYVNLFSVPTFPLRLSSVGFKNLMMYELYGYKDHNFNRYEIELYLRENNKIYTQWIEKNHNILDRKKISKRREITIKYYNKYFNKNDECCGYFRKGYASEMIKLKNYQLPKYLRLPIPIKYYKNVLDRINTEAICDYFIAEGSNFLHQVYDLTYINNTYGFLSLHYGLDRSNWRKYACKLFNDKIQIIRYLKNAKLEELILIIPAFINNKNNIEILWDFVPELFEKISQLEFKKFCFSMNQNLIDNKCYENLSCLITNLTKDEYQKCIKIITNNFKSRPELIPLWIDFIQNQCLNLYKDLIVILTNDK